MAFRFLHTSDWQIGMGHATLGEAAERLREARLEAAGRALAAARERGADAVLVAGDVFESDAVAPDLVRAVLDRMERAAVPVLVLPGNHDPLRPGSVFRSRAWRPPANVRLLGERAPLRVGDAEILPCPCLAPYSREDPTRWIPPREGSGGPVRMGIAHGTWLLVPDRGEEDHPIAADAAERLGLDYLALGHWHSRWPEPGSGDGDGRTFYCGSPEPTRFGESRSGGALWVEIDGSGATPRVEVVETAVHRWEEIEREVGADEDVETLRRELAAWSEPERTVLRLRLHGHLGAAGAQAVEDLARDGAARFLAFRLETEAVRLLPEDPGEWLGRRHDHVRAAAAELRERASAGDDTARRALLLLHRIALEEEPA